MSITLHPGDCMEVLPTLAENSIDACVCDPPYHLQSIVKRFSNEDPKKWLTFGANHGGGASPYSRTSTGFMGKAWDGGDIAFRPELWALVLRVLKPGGHLLAMGGTRTAHRMACAIEDAGFEIRDTLCWLYGSGFPKSHDVSKAIDHAAGAEREVVGRGASGKTSLMGGLSETVGEYGHDISIPATDAAREWEGWGTALKPAYEPIVLARKPLSEATIAANVLRWGTGALNIDGCRIGNGVLRSTGNGKRERSDGYGMQGGVIGGSELGRWPANVCHDGIDEVVEAFPETGPSSSHKRHQSGEPKSVAKGKDKPHVSCGPNDSGSAARFFKQCTLTDEDMQWAAGHQCSNTRAKNAGKRFWYSSKADADDRLGSSHPTVKPLDLMRWLVRMVTPPGGVVLDMFAGSGTTGEAAFREGMSAVLIEREAEYCADIRRRIALLLAGPDERARESIKASGRSDMHPGPLFGDNP